MKFPAFKEYANRVPNLNQVVDYLTIEHTANLKELITGLRNLDFLNNFSSFRATVTIPAGAEIGIENRIRGGIVPSDRIIVRSNSHEIVDGDTPWTKEFVYMKNLGAADATVTIVFLK